jgi:hypothetical protein
MGNRGGRFHTDAKTLTGRRWASRQWICCVLDFKGRRREVWGRFYTELFFLDEPTAFAAGHRPCFECRRKDAQLFAEKWGEVHRYRKPPYAAEMDNVLHAERLRGRVQRGTGATSTTCPTARLLHSMERPSPFVPTHSYTGRRRVTMLASRGRAALLSTCSPRRRQWESCQLAMNRAGTQAQRISLGVRKALKQSAKIDQAVPRPDCVGGRWCTGEQAVPAPTTPRNSTPSRLILAD